LAVQVADGADGFGENLKFAGGSDHCLILRLTIVLLRAHSAVMDYGGVKKRVWGYTFYSEMKKV
jgi:hypothetical protein